MPGGGARVIFLIILKWIGIILLCILAVLLFVGLCILFVPVRYHIWVECPERWRAKVRVSWLFPLFQFLFDTERPEKNGIRIAGIPVAGQHKSGKAPAKQVDKNLPADRSDKPESEVVENMQPDKPKSENAEHTQPDMLAEIPVSGRSDKSQQPRSRKKNSFLEKCRRLRKQIKNFCLSIRSIFAKIKAVDRESVEWIRLLAVNAGRLLKHICPRRIKGWVHFGTSDPALTGELLGGLSILFAMCGQGVRVIPDFEREVLEGELEIKGHLRGIVLLILIIKVHPLQLIRYFRREDNRKE